jgi:hypothetical protein
LGCPNLRQIGFGRVAESGKEVSARFKLRDGAGVVVAADETLAALQQFLSAQQLFRFIRADARVELR